MECFKVIKRKGEFLDAAAGAEILRLVETAAFDFADVDNLGLRNSCKYSHCFTYRSCFKPSFGTS